MATSAASRLSVEIWEMGRLLRCTFWHTLLTFWPLLFSLFALQNHRRQKDNACLPDSVEAAEFRDAWSSAIRRDQDRESRTDT